MIIEWPWHKGRKPHSTTITTQSGPDPIPEPPPSDYPNEPQDYTQIINEPFDSISSPSAGTWHDATGGSTTVSIVVDATAPKSPSNVAKYQYSVGQNVGQFPQLDVGFSARSEIYLKWWFLISNPWDYHVSGVNKLLFIGTNQNPVVINEVVLSLIGTSESGARLKAICQEPYQSLHGGDYCNPNVNSNILNLGGWHSAELLLVKNTGGLANGIMKWWLDDVLQGDYSDIMFNDTIDGKFNRLNFQHYWGGGVDYKDEIDYILDDHIYVSGKF